ncbi:MAG: Aspartate/tyrosine/aromatic aminotransferase [Candidatus Methanohalarchaeum thermophilum]|uniref:Aminotransferase n=1 Tax=Methanohalarchaeum thermophilum TaxID=1903181 RepID=A0A1Q6DX98_METT1|nr:MAG: Aspartate/tyrosine/aromatic aminotransferase [Candidatus Methanohalarchaeum thermophilum]
MSFSRKIQEISGSTIREVFEEAGEDSINLGLGEPDLDTPIEAKKEAKRSIDKNQTNYTSNKGLIGLRKSICDYIEKFNIFVNPSNVIVTSGGSEALHIATEALIGFDDEAMIPDPGFVSYDPLVKIAGGKSVPYSLNEENGFSLNLESIKERINNKTKVVFLNSPSNPTGAVLGPEEVKAVTELADDYGAYIISDEVYSEIIYGKNHVSPKEFYDKVIVVDSFSKTFSMTGWRVGYLLADEGVIDQSLKVHQYIQACAPSISQKAANKALSDSMDYISYIRDKFMKRRDLVMKKLDDIKEIDYVEPSGAFYIFPNVSKLGGGKKVSRKLAERDVITVPGSAFGREGRDYIRMSYANSKEKLKEGLDRFSKLCKDLEF